MPRARLLVLALLTGLVVAPAAAPATGSAFAACAQTLAGGAAKPRDCTLSGTMSGSLAYGAGDRTYWTATWSGTLRFQPVSRYSTRMPRYVLARGSSVRWSLSGADSDCSYVGSGSLDATKLKGEVSIGEQLREGLWHYGIEVRAGDSPNGKPLMPITQTCNGASDVIDAAVAHGRFPFVVTGIFGKVAAKNEQTNSLVLEGDAVEQGSRWSWRVSGPVFADEISQHGVDFIKTWEGLAERCNGAGVKSPGGQFICAYEDNAPTKNCTIGYGKLLHKGPCTAADRRLRWTEQQAEQALRTEIGLSKYQGVRDFSRTYGLNQCQFDALMSFIYNHGPGPFRTLTAGVTKDTWEGVIAQRLPFKYTAGGKLLVGLVRRRQAEFKLFLTTKCPCAGVPAPRPRDIPTIENDPCKPPPGYKKAPYCT